MALCLPNVFQSIERERTNGKTETMKNIFLEIDLENLNREVLRQGIDMVNYGRDNEIGG